jgi:hypothetical protein
MKEVHSIINSIRAEIERAKTQLAGLESAITSLTLVGNEADAKTQPKPRRRKAKKKRRNSPYRTAIVDLLRDHAAGLTTKEITKLLAARGVKPLSKNPHIIIAASTRRLFRQGSIGRKKRANGLGVIYLPATLSPALETVQGEEVNS